MLNWWFRRRRTRTILVNIRVHDKKRSAVKQVSYKVRTHHA